MLLLRIFLGAAARSWWCPCGCAGALTQGSMMQSSPAMVAGTEPEEPETTVFDLSGLPPINGYIIHTPTKLTWRATGSARSRRSHSAQQRSILITRSIRAAPTSTSSVRRSMNAFSHAPFFYRVTSNYSVFTFTRSNYAVFTFTTASDVTSHYSILRLR